MSRTLQIVFSKARCIPRQVPKDVCGLISKHLSYMEFGVLYCSATQKDKWYDIIVKQCFAAHDCLDDFYLGITTYHLNSDESKVIPWIMTVIADTWMQKNGWDFPIPHKTRRRVYRLLPHTIPFKLYKTNKPNKTNGDGKIDIIDYANIGKKTLLKIRMHSTVWDPVLTFKIPDCLPPKHRWEEWIQEEAHILNNIPELSRITCTVDAVFSCCSKCHCSNCSFNYFYNSSVKVVSKDHLFKGQLQLHWLIFSIHIATNRFLYQQTCHCENIFVVCRQLYDMGVPFPPHMLEYLKKKSKLFKIYLECREGN